MFFTISLPLATRKLEFAIALTRKQMEVKARCTTVDMGTFI